jgi:uncharacterized membrane protein YfcA
MSALAASPVGRTICLAAFFLMASTIVGPGSWHFGWLRYGLTDLAHQAPSWVAVSIVIFIAASLSSTVGFAFSAIAAAMIFHLVPDTVEAVQIMMVASIAIQAYSVAGMWRTISLRACAPFLVGGIATMPAGIYLLLSFRPHAYVFTMGLALALYGAYMLFRPRGLICGGCSVPGAVQAFGCRARTTWHTARGASRVHFRGVGLPSDPHCR